MVLSATPCRRNACCTYTRNNARCRNNRPGTCQRVDLSAVERSVCVIKATHGPKREHSNSHEQFCLAISRQRPCACANTPNCQSATSGRVLPRGDARRLRLLRLSVGGDCGPAPDSIGSGEECPSRTVCRRQVPRRCR
ncbi:hypothetical protein LSAT2_025329 [Lamellibrachia satsuma]|nr:hypothetical protein LSAT2_025329 [Lamellibrachia satsuma]